MSLLVLFGGAYQPKVKVRVAGSFVQSSTVNVRVGGVWVQAKAVYVMVGGVWTLV